MSQLENIHIHDIQTLGGRDHTTHAMVLRTPVLCCCPFPTPAHVTYHVTIESGRRKMFPFPFPFQACRGSTWQHLSAFGSSCLTPIPSRLTLFSSLPAQLCSAVKFEAPQGLKREMKTISRMACNSEIRVNVITIYYYDYVGKN